MKLNFKGSLKQIADQLLAGHENRVFSLNKKVEGAVKVLAMDLDGEVWTNENIHNNFISEILVLVPDWKDGVFDGEAMNEFCVGILKSNTVLTYSGVDFKIDTIDYTFNELLDMSLAVASGNKEDLHQLPFEKALKKPIAIGVMQMPVDFSIATIEGTLSGSAGDYLARGVEGEYYPIKKSIFEKTYDIV